MPRRGKGRNPWDHAAGNRLSPGPQREAAAPREPRLSRTPELAGAPAGVRAGRAAVGSCSPPVSMRSRLNLGGLGGAGLGQRCLTGPGHQPCPVPVTLAGSQRGQQLLPRVCCRSCPFPMRHRGVKPAAARSWGSAVTGWSRWLQGHRSGAPGVRAPPASWPWTLSCVMCVSKLFLTCWPEH